MLFLLFLLNAKNTKGAQSNYSAPPSRFCSLANYFISFLMAFASRFTPSSFFSFDM